jgi:hypothetical protein
MPQSGDALPLLVIMLIAGVFVSTGLVLTISR